MKMNSKARAFTDRHASIEDLDRSIVNLAVQMNRITHDFLVLVRRFDERAGWLKWGCDSCAEWLHYRCDISKSAAREKVRVAHAIKTLPAIAVAFAEGKLSYSKVRALTRVATPANEEELLTFALRTTAARVEGGFTIEKDYKDQWFFRRPDGRAVPACGYRLDDVTDDDIGTVDEYFDEDASAEALRASAEASRWASAETRRASAEAPRSPAGEYTANEPSAEAWTVGETFAAVYGCGGVLERASLRGNLKARLIDEPSGAHSGSQAAGTSPSLWR